MALAATELTQQAQQQIIKHTNSSPSTATSALSANNNNSNNSRSNFHQNISSNGKAPTLVAQAVETHSRHHQQHYTHMLATNNTTPDDNLQQHYLCAPSLTNQPPEFMTFQPQHFVEHQYPSTSEHQQLHVYPTNEYQQHISLMPEADLHQLNQQQMHLNSTDQQTGFLMADCEQVAPTNNHHTARYQEPQANGFEYHTHSQQNVPVSPYMMQQEWQPELVPSQLCVQQQQLSDQTQQLDQHHHLHHHHLQHHNHNHSQHQHHIQDHQQMIEPQQLNQDGQSMPTAGGATSESAIDNAQYLDRLGNFYLSSPAQHSQQDNYQVYLNHTTDQQQQQQQQRMALPLDQLLVNGSMNQQLSLNLRAHDQQQQHHLHQHIQLQPLINGQSLSLD